MTTLKKNYEAKRQHTLQERVNVTRLIIENFDKKTAEKSIQLIKRLNAIKWPDELSLFKSASKKAVAELQQVLAGQGRQKGLFDKLVNLFKRQTDNPFVDVIAYASAVNQFFSILNKYIDAANDSDAKVLGDLFAGSEETFHAIVKKGLKPDGILANISTNWFQKYLGNDQNIYDMADELLTMPIDSLKKLCGNVTETLSNVGNVASVIGATDEATKAQKNVPVDTHTEPESQENPEEETTGTTQTKPNTVRAGTQNSNATTVNLKNNVVKRVKPALEDMGIKDVTKLIDTLEDLGVLKEPS